MKTTATIIVDNKSGGVPGEWGLSVYAEHNGSRILLDTGASGLFLSNMERLGIDVKDTDLAVLSHAHCDHANGMPAFFEHNQKAKFYVSENTAPDCYGRILFINFYCGIPKTMMEKYQDRIVKVADFCEIADGVYIVPHRSGGYPEIGKKGHMFRKVACGFIPDDLSHEQSLVLDTVKGLVIFNSCSHAGADNIINEVRKALPGRKIYGFIGGLHLFDKKEAEIREAARKIRESGIEYICTGHCTKDRAYRILREELGDMAEQMRTGYKIEF